MSSIEHVREIAASLGNFEFDAGTDLIEVIKVSSVIRIGNKITSERQEEEPDRGKLFTLLKPAALKDAFKEAQHISAVTPQQVVSEYADEWLANPVLKGSVSRRSDILAYRPASEKVVDRVEVNQCAKCRGACKVVETRQEPVYYPCPGGCSGGVVYSQGYVNAPGTTAHGQPTTESRMCGHCGGKGKVYSHSRNVQQTHSCRDCRGKGEVEKTYYRRNTFYWAYRVETSISVKGREITSNILKTLRRVTKSEDLSLERLRATASAMDIAKVAAPSKISLDFELTISLRRYLVSSAEGEVGQVFVIPGLADPLVAADRAFLDKPLKARRKFIAGMTVEPFLQSVDGNAMLKFLMDAVDAGRGIESSDLAWSISSRPLKRMLRTVRKAAGREPGILSKIMRLGQKKQEQQH